MQTQITTPDHFLEGSKTERKNGVLEAPIAAIQRAVKSAFAKIFSTPTYGRIDTSLHDFQTAEELDSPDVLEWLSHSYKTTAERDAAITLRKAEIAKGIHIYPKKRSPQLTLIQGGKEDVASDQTDQVQAA